MIQMVLWIKYAEQDASTIIKPKGVKPPSVIP